MVNGHGSGFDPVLFDDAPRVPTPPSGPKLSVWIVVLLIAILGAIVAFDRACS